MALLAPLLLVARAIAAGLGGEGDCALPR